MGKAAAVLLNFNPLETSTDKNGNYHFTNYTYNRIDQNGWPLDGHATDGGKLTQKFSASDMTGSNFRFYIIPTTQVAWQAPSVIITVQNKTTGASASPFVMPGGQNPCTVAFNAVQMPQGLAWYYDIPFQSSPTPGKYTYGVTATFASGNDARTYFVDPEMDCSSDSTDCM